MDTTAANKKDLEANGHVDETTSEGSSEQFNTERKSSRRMEYVYISIAVVLGAALIAVLVYFTVTNAMKTEPESVSSMDSMTTTEDPNDQIDYDSLFGGGSNDGNTGSNGGGSSFDKNDVSGLLRISRPDASQGQSGSVSAGDLARTGNTGPQTASTAAPTSATTGTTTTAARRTFRPVGGGNPFARSVNAPTDASSSTTTTTTTTTTASSVSGENVVPPAHSLVRGAPLRNRGLTPAQDQTTTTATTTTTTMSTNTDENSDVNANGQTETGGRSPLRLLGVGNPVTNGDSDEGGDGSNGFGNTETSDSETGAEI